jgi:hypothetical protein
MADKRIYELATEMVVIDTAAEIIADKLGYAEGQRLSLDKVFQELTFTKATKTLDISDKNSVVLDLESTPEKNISGFELSYLGATQMSIGSGNAKDDTNTYAIQPITMTKNLVGWSAGNNGGLLDAGVLAANSVYYLFAIYDSTNDVSDFLASLSLTAPTLPGVYDKYQVIGMFKTVSTVANLSKRFIATWQKYYAFKDFFNVIPENFVSDFYFAQQTILGTNYALFGNIYTRDYFNQVNMYLEYSNPTNIIAVPTYYQKEYDALFTEGQSGGALEAALVANTNYYVYLIQKTNLFADVYITTKNNAALFGNLPAGFSYYKQIGIGFTDYNNTLYLHSVNDLDKDYQTSQSFTPTAILETGTTDSGDATFLGDSTQAWTDDEWIGNVVKIDSNGLTMYALIADNDATTLTFDSNTPYAVVGGETYSILETYHVKENAKNIILAIYGTEHGAVVLPVVSAENDRNKIDLYVEQLTADKKIGVVAQSANDIFGEQYFSLESYKEFIELLQHNTASPHFDIVQQNNFDAFIEAYYTANWQLAANTDWQNAGQTSAQTTVDFKRRFIKNEISSEVWYEYNCITTRTFNAKFFAQVTKSGAAGAGEVNISWRKYTKATAATTDLDTRQAQTYLAAADGSATIVVSIPVELALGDRLIPIIKRAAGTISLDSGSYISIQEE